MKMRRLIRPRSASTSPPISAPMSPSSILCGEIGPVVGRHQPSPTPVDPPVVDFAVAIVPGPGFQIFVEMLVAQAHLVAEEVAPGHRAPSGLGATLPIVHVVLLECAGRAKHPHPGQPN